MSARYISRRYTSTYTDTSTGDRSLSRSRGPSMTTDMAATSRSSSRSSSPYSSRPTSPTTYYSYDHQSTYSRATTPPSRGAATTTGEYYYSSRRSLSPTTRSYTDALCAASRRLRERSIPPPPPLPERPEGLMRAFSPVGDAKPPIMTPRVVASDFYRGKVKSIYEREPLFRDFCRTIPDRHGNINMYNSATLDTLKHEFKSMVEDKWFRKNKSDPSVEHDFGTKLYPWRNVMAKEAEPASTRIMRAQAARPRQTTPARMPRVYVYHRSTLS